MIFKLCAVAGFGTQIAGALGEQVELENSDELGPGQCLLSKRSWRTDTADKSEEIHISKFKPRTARRTMTYFQDWNAGLTWKNLDPPKSLLVQGERKLVNAVMSALVQQHPCLEQTLIKQNWTLLDRDVSDGVGHLLFKTGGTASKLQYIASRRNRVLTADPPMECGSEQQLEGQKRGIIGAATDILHPQDDKMVKDCKQLFEETAKDICNKKMKVKVLRADRQVIDGVQVNMDVEVTGLAGKTTHHSPSCFFEFEGSAKDASLLESLVDLSDADPNESGKRGMTATLRTFANLCKADEEDGKDVLRDVPSLGLLAFTKGYEHLDDELPRASFPLRHDLPNDFDMRIRYPKCFQQNGKEVIRQQGACASCWAFSGASTLMNNLCTSNEDSGLVYASPTDRYEVSVQQMMSCNAEQKGCGGGYASSVHNAMSKHGINKERLFPYQCGGGPPKDHWTRDKNGSCARWPWGARCEAGSVPGWHYGGAFRIIGEMQMQTLLSQGHSLFVGMIIYENFQGHGDADVETRKKVYSRLSGKNLGGHAMTGIGYGVQGGEKYWLLQNSWSANWGVDGTIKVKRGVNLARIEDYVFYFRGWVDGASRPEMPMCRDAEKTLFQFACGSWMRPAWCKDDPELRLSCPVTCNTCNKLQKVAPTPAPTPYPTPLPTPAPTPHPPFWTRCWKNSECDTGNRDDCIKRDCQKKSKKYKSWAYCSFWAGSYKGWCE